MDNISDEFDSQGHISGQKLRSPQRNDAKMAKICNLWTFWLVIQLINHLFKIQKKALLPNTP